MRKTFKSTATGRTLRISGDAAGLNVTINNVAGLAGVISLSHVDAPTLALAILEAAGVEPVPFDECPETEAGHAAWVLRHHVQESERKAKEAADREALEKRRDEVANELLEGTISYKMCNLHFQRAIDRIIELEDRAKS